MLLYISYIKIPDIKWIFREIYFSVYCVWYSFSFSRKFNKMYAYILKIDYCTVCPICTIIRVVSLKEILPLSDRKLLMTGPEH